MIDSVSVRDALATPSADPVVHFEHVGLRYDLGPEVFRDITFTLPAGSFHFLTGGSGAGKSSVLGLCYLALRPTRGDVTLFGHNILKAPRQVLTDLRRRMGVVFQDFRLIDHLSALDNVALPLRVAGVSETDIRRHVPELLAWVGLADHLNARPPTLSGGQKQRVAIARAVINRPELLLADEPTGNVDDRIAMRLLHLFEELNKMGTTVLIATHNDQLVRRFPYPRLLLEGGRLRLQAPDETAPSPAASAGAPEAPAGSASAGGS